MSVPPTLRLPSGVTRGRLGTLAALSAGTGGPPVLLVPGFTGSKEDFLAILAPLAAGRRVVAIDLPGQLDSPGGSDPAAYAVDALATTVLDAAAGFDGPLHLVGHSFGGLVARAAVLQRPAAVRTLTLIGSGPAGLPGAPADRLRALRPVLDAGGVPAVWATTSAFDAAQPGYLPPSPEVADWLRQRFLATPALALAAMADALVDEPDRTDALAATGLPMLVLHGATDDAWPPELQAAMATRLGAVHAVIPGSAHSPAAENPAATVHALVKFWEDV